eukprot:XP_014785111.1 PREDICTED: SCAN domain-containing protein 3-like [Octopus bimaculoides]
MKVILGEQQAHQLRAISLSNDTVKNQILDMSENILLQVVTAVKSSPVYSLQLDESTDVASCSQFLVHVHYLDREVMNEEYLFSEPVATTTRREDISKILEAFLIEQGLSWEALVGLYTDEALSMIGCKSSFKAFVKNVAPYVSFTDCMIHCYTLAMKSLSPGLQEVLTNLISIFENLKCFNPSIIMFSIITFSLPFKAIK